MVAGTVIAVSLLRRASTPLRRWFGRVGQAASDFCLATDGHHDRQSPTVRHRRPFVQHAESICDGGSRHRSRLLGHWERLAGQNGFIDLTGFGLENAAVGRHHLARLQFDQVAAHQLLALEGQRCPGTPDRDQRARHLDEAFDGHLGAGRAGRLR